MTPRYAFAPPMGIHLFSHDGDGGRQTGLCSFGYAIEIDGFSRQGSFTLDETAKIQLRFLASVAPYRLLCLIPMNRVLFGPADPFYLLDTDRLGRDMFSRLVHGARLSMSIGLIGMAISLVLGLLLGGLSGYFGGLVDDGVQRTIEFLKSIPQIPLWMGLAAAIHAVDDVTFDIKARETLSFVGESGCGKTALGKTTLGKTIMRVYAPTSGWIDCRRADGTSVDLAKLQGAALKAAHRDISMIFQDPNGSLNPRMTLRDIVGEPLLVNGLAKGRELEDRAGGLLEKVGLRPEYLHGYPQAFAGGEHQRIGIARTLALTPRLVADEAVSALDVSIQAQTLNLLADLKAELSLTFLFIAHDLSVVRHISDRVAVMYVGRLVELVDTETLFQNPRHPYTVALLSAVPLPDLRLRGKRRRIRLKGEVASPIHPPACCAFHPRCAYATERCRREVPELSETTDGAKVACHHAETLELRGVRAKERAA